MPVSEHDRRFEQVVQAVAAGSRLLGVQSLQGGMSAQMTLLEIERPDGRTRSLILRRPGAGTLKWNPRAAEDQFKLLQVTQSLGLSTPAPYHLDLSGKIFSTPYLVIEYIAGGMDFSPSDLDGYLLQLAAHLAEIHRVDYRNHDLSFLPKQAKRFADNVEKRPANLNSSLDEGRIRKILESVPTLFQRNRSALLHGDFWPGNTLWQEGRLVAVIDWEDAKLGDPLADLAISRLDIVWIFGTGAMHAFTGHYRSMMPIDTTNLPYWDLWAALRLIRLAGHSLAAWAAFFPPFGRHDITEHTMRGHYRYFVTQAFEELTVQRKANITATPGLD